MALASQAALLDELMGRDRNKTSVEEKEMKWYSSDVCKNFLSGFCPNELFINTKADMGPCELIHDKKLLENYRHSKQYKQMGYESDLRHLLEKMVYEVDKKIVSNKRRLKENGSTVVGGIVIERKKKIEEINIAIDKLLTEVEELGNEGKIYESQQKMSECEELQKEKKFFENDIELHINNAKEMEVCEICGAMQVKNDIALRIKEHEEGRMHVGFTKVRELVKSMNRQSHSSSSKSTGHENERSRSRAKHRSHDERRQRSRSYEKHSKRRR